MKIRNAMYRMVCLLILVPFLIFSAFVLYLYNARMNALIAESLQAVANVQIAEMTDFCERQMNELQMLGSVEMVQEALQGDISDEDARHLDGWLYARKEAAGSLYSISVIDRANRVVACSEAQYAGIADSGLNRLIEELGDAPFYISDMCISGADKEERRTVIALSKIESDGEVIGYALAEINRNFYQNIREKAGLPGNFTFYLLDGDQQIISAGTSSAERESFVSSEQERQDYERKYRAIDFEKYPSGNFTYKLGGKNYITYYSDVRYTDWQILLSASMDEYLSRRIVYKVLAVTLAVVCVALAVWVGAFTSHRIVRPINRISDTLRAIQEKQDYTMRVKIDHEDELGKLAVSINQLLCFIETENLYKMQRQRLLQVQADQDALTKVMNKTKIREYLQKALEKHQAARTEMAVLFIDIDDFKAFNTNYGHNVGDQVLLFIAALVKRDTRGAVGRVGGDEFLVVVESEEVLANLEDCLTQINRNARSQFSRRGTGEQLPITCCIGAVVVDFDAEGMHQITAEQIIDRTDAAMYRAKNSGKRGHIIEYIPGL